MIGSGKLALGTKGCSGVFPELGDELRATVWHDGFGEAVESEYVV